MPRKTTGDIDTIRSAIRPRLARLQAGGVPPAPALKPHTHSADQLTYEPGGNIVATTVQAAIEELDNEKLARDGSQTMLGSLDMDHHDLANVNDAEIENDATIGRDASVGQDLTVGRDVLMIGGPFAARVSGPRRIEMTGEDADGESLIEHVERLLFVGTPTGGLIDQPSRVDWNTLVDYDSDHPERVGSMGWDGGDTTPIATGEGTLVVSPASGAGDAAFAHGYVLFLDNPTPGSSITVGGFTYGFGFGGIPIGATADDTAQNLTDAINANTSTHATAEHNFANEVDLTAVTAGAIGNEPISCDDPNVSVAGMGGGADGAPQPIPVALGWDVLYCVAGEVLAAGQVVRMALFDAGDGDFRLELSDPGEHPVVYKYAETALGQPEAIQARYVVGLAMSGASPGNPVQVMRRGIFRGPLPDEAFGENPILWADPSTSYPTNVRPAAPFTLVRVGVGIAIDVQVIEPPSTLSGVVVEEPEDRDVFVYDAALASWVPKRLYPSTDQAADYAIDPLDFLVRVDASAGPIVVTLPLPGPSTSRMLDVKKIDPSSNAVTIAADSSDIEGDPSFDLLLQGESVTLQCDGLSWAVL